MEYRVNLIFLGATDKILLFTTTTEVPEADKVTPRLVDVSFQAHKPYVLQSPTVNSGEAGEQQLLLRARQLYLRCRYN